MGMGFMWDIPNGAHVDFKWVSNPLWVYASGGHEPVCKGIKDMVDKGIMQGRIQRGGGGLNM